MFDKIIILYHYFQALRRMKFGKIRLLKWQAKHKIAITHFAKTHSPFYKNFKGDHLSKQVMMDNFTDFNTVKIEKENAFNIALKAEKTRTFATEINGIAVGLSSGTTGNRGLFLVSKNERLKWCGNILARILPKAPWKAQKIALFLRANSNLYETINSGTLKFVYFDLLEDIATLKRKIQEFDPDVVVAPPSMLNHLIGTCKPIKIVSVAETLTSQDEKHLEKAFKQKIYQIYQCTEGFLGFTCSHGSLHLNEDLLIIEKEYIDKHAFIPIITDLFRTTQPIIRYRLDDVLVEKTTPCACGCVFQALERIEGRCDDLLYVALPDGGMKPLFPDFVSRKIITASEKIVDYEVIQTHLDRWEVYLNQDFRKLAAQSLQELFTDIKCLPPKLVFLDKPYPKVPGAKLRRVRREYLPK